MYRRKILGEDNTGKSTVILTDNNGKLLITEENSEAIQTATEAIQAALEGFEREQIFTRITRPANTTAYGTNQAVADVIPVTNHKILNAARSLGGTGAITGVQIRTNNINWTNALTLVLYKEPPTDYIADGETFDGKWVDDLNIIRVVQLAGFTTMGANAAGGIRRTGHFSMYQPFKCKSTSKDLYFQMFTQDGTPTSGQLFDIIVDVEKD